MFTGFSFGTSVCFANALIYGSMVEHKNCDQNSLQKANRFGDEIRSLSPLTMLRMLRVQPCTGEITPPGLAARVTTLTAHHVQRGVVEPHSICQP